MNSFKSSRMSAAFCGGCLTWYEIFVCWLILSRGFIVVVAVVLIFNALFSGLIYLAYQFLPLPLSSSLELSIRNQVTYWHVGPPVLQRYWCVTSLVSESKNAWTQGQSGKESWLPLTFLIAAWWSLSPGQWSPFCRDSFCNSGKLNPTSGFITWVWPWSPETRGVFWAPVIPPPHFEMSRFYPGT